MLPDGWRKFKLADLSLKAISYGIVQTGEPVEQGIPCIRVVDLTASELDPHKMITTSEEINQSYKRTILEEGELMLALRGEIGLVRLVDKRLVGCNLTRGVARISPSKKLVLPEFLLWAIRSPLFRDDLLRRVNGSALQEIPIIELRKTIVPVPPMHEQKRISEILATWDEAISLTERAIEAKQKRKTALMKLLLKAAYLFSSNQTVRLKDVASVKTEPFGSLLHESDYKDSGTPIITVEHLSENGIIHHNLPLVSDNDKNRLSAYILKEGDIVFSRVGSVDRSSAVSKLEDGWLFSGRLLRVRPDSQKVCYKFLNYFFHRQAFKNQIRSLAVGGTMPCLNTQILENIHILLPSIERQKSIAETLEICDEEIYQTRKILNLLILQKRGLMQKLLTGEWRTAVQAAA